MNDSWIIKAEKLAGALSDVPSGEKLLQTERVAQEYGLSYKTVEQLLRAYGFLERLRTRDPEVGSVLNTLPYQAVMALQRWYDRDRDQMLEYLEKHPGPSVRKVTAAEKASRGSRGSAEPAEHAIDVLATIDTLLPGKALSRMLTWAGMDPFDLGTANWRPISQEYERTLGIEYSAAMQGEHRMALLVGPASPASGHYMRHAKSIWCNGVCATRLYPLVIMLLPSKAAQSACLTSMPLPPSGDGNWPDWNAKSGPRGQPRSGPARPASPTGGIILFSSPEGIGEDWQK